MTVCLESRAAVGAALGGHSEEVYRVPRGKKSLAGSLSRRNGT